MLEKIYHFIKSNALLVSIFLLGLFLRLLGVWHELPYVFHPDEPTIIRSALGIRFFPNPKHFDWPHLYIYLNFFIYMGFGLVRRLTELVGLRPWLSQVVPGIWQDPANFYLITRCLTALLGALTVVPVYLAGKLLFSRRVGLLSALLIAVLPYHVHHSHFALADVPMVFLLSWAFYFSVRVFLNARLKDFLFAGLFVGLSASAKYNGGLSAIFVILAVVLRYLYIHHSFDEFAKDLKKGFLAGSLSVVGFLLGTPYALLDFDTFSRTDGPQGAFWQFTNVGSVSLGKQFEHLYLALWDKFLPDWGLPILVLFLISTLYASYLTFNPRISKRIKAALFMILLPLWGFLFYISGFSKNRSHYYMIAYPVLALLIGWFIDAVYSWVSPCSVWRFVFLGLFSSALGFTFYLSLVDSVSFARKDTRVLARDFLLDSRLPSEVSAVYFDGSGLDQTLSKIPSKKLPKRSRDRVYPFVLVTFCYKHTVSVSPLAYFPDTFRNGDPVCIYLVDSQDVQIH